jgi:lysylphosphatidylglycerol synthetase-like protein (DUF2156 family)
MNPARGIAISVFVLTVTLLPGGPGAAVLAILAFPLWYSSIEKRSRRRALTGTVVALGAIVVAGLRGLDASLLVIAGVALVLGWTLTTHVIGLREQLDDTADIERALLAHVGTTTAATTTIGGVMYAGFIAGPTFTPLALVLVLVGTVPILLGIGWLRR